MDHGGKMVSFCKAYIMGCSGFTGSLKNFTILYIDAFFDVVEPWCAAYVLIMF